MDLWSRSPALQHETISIVSALPGSMVLKPFRDAKFVAPWKLDFEDVQVLAAYLSTLHTPHAVDEASREIIAKSWWSTVLDLTP